MKRALQIVSLILPAMVIMSALARVCGASDHPYDA